MVNHIPRLVNRIIVRPSFVEATGADYRETRIGQATGSGTDTYTKWIKSDNTSGSGAINIEIDRDVSSVYTEYRTYAKFFQPIKDGDYFYSDTWTSQVGNTFVGSLFFEHWLLTKSDIDINAMTWANQPVPNDDTPNFDLRFASHIKLTSGANLNIRQTPNAIWHVNGLGGTYYGMLSKIVIKTGGIIVPPAGFVRLDLGNLYLITSRPRTTFTAVTNRASTGGTRTLTLTAPHPFVVGMQIDISGVDSGTNTYYNSKTTGGLNGSDQRTISFADATTIKYAGGTTLSEGTTSCTGTIKYN